MARKEKGTEASDGTAAVDALMAQLAHPHADAIDALRSAVRTADPSIAEGVKWNAPSFRTVEWFATVHLRAKRGIALILHLGAKARPDAALAIDDPDRLLTWLGKDRASIAFDDADAVRARAAAVQAIVRQWIRDVA